MRAVFCVIYGCFVYLEVLHFLCRYVILNIFMKDFEELKKLIDPHKTPDRKFYLDLLDDGVQREVENEHIKAVMLMLKVVYINKLKAKISSCEERRKKLNESEEHTAENYKSVLELNKRINAYREKINTFKPFFDEPYFARMDLVDDKEGYNSYYIGKKGEQELEIVDWRAPLARRFYQKSNTSFSINDYNYKLILRRALRTGKGKVLDMKNEYLSLKDYLTPEEIAGRDESVIFDPFLKEILKTRKEKSEICDIIETIQEKQYEIITLPERAEFVLQGVAGSGKTMIMLHRLSYILYNNEKLRPSDMLVITPSDSFNAFIDELSTILELERVKTLTLDNYFLNLLKNAGVNLKGKTDYSQTVPKELLSYIYSEKFVTDVRKKLAKIFDSVHGMLVSDDCKEIAKSIFEGLKKQEDEYEILRNSSLRVRRCILGEIKEKPNGGGIYYTKQFRNMFNCISEVRDFLALLSDKKMEGMAYFYRQLLSFYKSLKFLRRYSEKICLTAIDDLNELFKTVEKEINDLRRYKIKIAGEETLTYADRIEKREQLKKEITSSIERIKRILNCFLPVYDFADVLRGEGNLVAIGRCESTYDILRFFYRETVKKVKLRYMPASKKLCKSDIFALCFLLVELGFELTPKYGFVFVDEAQDISSAEYKVLKAVNDRASFNVFGDLKQNITPYRGIGEWSALSLPVYNLNLNYRNTNQIVEYVSKSLNSEMQSIGFDGCEVEEIDCKSVTKYLSEKNGLRAVITSEKGLEKYFRKSYNLLSKTGAISKSKINIMTVYESKGLEFTAVAVADGDMSDNEKYIAYTRALKYLAIIK